MFDAINLAILIGAGLVALSALTSLISQRIGAPLLLVFLAIGLLAGEDGLLGIDFDSGATAYFIGSLALAIILFDSGFQTSLRSYRLAAAPALVLATIGVVLTTAFVGLAAVFLLDLGWVQGLMLGAIVASTDAAAVFFLLRVGGLTLRDRAKATLEVESGANDPMAIFLTATFVEFAAATDGLDFSAGWWFLVDFAQQIGLGLVLGAVGGAMIVWLLGRLRGLDPGLYPIAGLAAALVVFATTGLLGGSGFLATYVAGVIAGNSRLRYAFRVRRFQLGTTWLAQIGMFLTLGLLATPSEFGAVALPAVGLAVFLILVARPLAVWLCLLPFNFTWRETMFVSWVGLRGAVSILLAILPGLGGLAGGDMFFNVVFIMVLVSLLTQGWTIGIAARLLRLVAAPQPGLVNRVELELPTRAELELVGYRIHPDSAVAKGERVPRWARPTLILRDGRSFSIHNAGPLQPNDQVYLLASPRQLALLDQVYTTPALAEDRAVYGDFKLRPSVTLGELKREYGALVADADAHITAGDRLTSEFHGQPVVGDRLSLGPVEIVVSGTDDEGNVTEVGLVLEPKLERRGIRSVVVRLIRFLRGY